MSKVKVELNKSGVRELLLSNEIGQFCQEQASRIASRHGSATVGGIYKGKNRVNVAITAPNDSNANDLLRSIK